MPRAMDAFEYRDGALTCEGVLLSDIADAVGTPVYVYSHRTLIEHLERLRAAFALQATDPLICFSVKSLPNVEILKRLVAHGAGLDIVSGGELHRARLAGVDPARCVYAGVGKTDDEISAALRAGIGLFNIESEAEFENLASLASRERKIARAALRINPDVDPRTHRYTTTGKRETKFGVDLDRARAFFRAADGVESVRLTGLHLHIGSPVYDPAPYREAVTRTVSLMDAIESDHRGRIFETLDVGGGFGADYETGQSPALAEYAEAIAAPLRSRTAAGLRLILEPGRMIAANAGVLLVRVVYTKQSGERQFVICDAGMNALLRPALYSAFHFIWPAEVAPAFVPPRRGRDVDLPGLVLCDVVGPLCESGDFLGEARRLPPVARGDLLAVHAAGAYGMSMANRYNSSPLPAEVLVRDGEATLIRSRESFADLTAHERAAVLDGVGARDPVPAGERS